MSDAASVARDPNFRSQYDGGLRADPDVEAALAGYAAPVSQMAPATRPLPSALPWAQPTFVRLR